MFDVGFQEVFLIGIVALVVVGPERLPALAASVGRWVGKTRRFVAGVKSDFARELESGDLHKMLGDQKEQINELRSLVNSTRKDLESTATDAVESAKAKLDSADALARETLSDDEQPKKKGHWSGLPHVGKFADDADNSDDLPKVGTPVPVPEELKNTNQSTDDLKSEQAVGSSNSEDSDKK